MNATPSQIRKYIAIFSLGLCSATSFLLPFTKFYFYDAWVAAMGCSHKEAGLLMTVYALFNTLFFIPGGWLADRFSAKKILVFSTIGTAGLNFLFAFNQNYKLAIFIWFALAITTAFAFWGALMKAVRLCGTDEEQGKMYGFYNGGDGIFAFIVLNLALLLFAKMVAQGLGEVAGYTRVLMFQGACCLVAAAMVQIFFTEGLGETGADKTKSDKMDLSKLGLVAKQPSTWYIALVIFCGYGLFTASSYLQPYLENGMQVAVSIGVFMAIVRTKICRMLFGPLGGTLADKFKTSSLVSVCAYIFIILVFVFLYFLPIGSTYKTLAIIATTAAAAGIFTVYGIMFSSISEAKIPRSHTGTVIGLASIIGYSSDYWVNSLFGSFIDNDVAGSGYKKIFLVLIGFAILGIISSIIVYRHGKKENKKQITN